MKAPYSFPLRSRAAIADFLTRRGRSYDYRRYNFAWNVKTHGANFDGDSLRAHFPELNPALDSEWDSYVAKNNSLWYQWQEDAARNSGVQDDEWTSYPGDDQGDWSFHFAGRSCGWIVLCKWRGRNMWDIDSADFLDPEIWPFADLKAFYRGIVCADQDFTPVKAAREVEFFAADCRAQWEAEKREESELEAQEMACEIAAARPDLSPYYSI